MPRATSNRPTINRRLRRCRSSAGGRGPANDSQTSSRGGEVPPGAETAELEGWRPFAWKHNALRHSFISYRVALVEDVAKVSLEAGNSPRMVFSNYRGLVRAADAQKWFGITPEAVEAAKAAREKS